MSEDSEQGEVHQEKKVISFSDFLESATPGKIVNTIFEFEMSYGNRILIAPVIQVYCEGEQCNGLRFFSTSSQIYIKDEWSDGFLDYVCKNCHSFSKRFALALNYEEKIAYKYGELPPFGPPTPSRVISLIGPDKDLYIMGKRAESQGMGIGAFVYYRRVVERQKDRIFDEIIRIAEVLEASPEFIDSVRSAKQETQFTKAVNSIKKGLPQVLLLKGHNPLTLLHKALSQGVHDHTDKECLELAQSIRTILTEMAERMGEALKDTAEIHKAVTHLIKSSRNKSQ